MQPIDITKRTIGINVEEGKAVINIWSPQSDKVAVVTDDTSIQLQKDAYGYWQATTDKIGEGGRYRIRLNDDEPLPDPSSLSQPDGVHGASEVVSLHRFNWADDNWSSPSLHQYIIYELHTGTFTSEGSFESIINRLDYLKELGITAIEIMPIAQFSGDRNWGYDGAFPFAVQNSYGGAKGLQQLVNACHQKGIAVILDVVYNHLGPEGAYLHSFGPYFTDKYNTPWGPALNFDDAWCDGARRFFIENALMWFRDFHIDALRLDAVHAIKDFSATHILEEIKIYVDELMKLTGKTYHLITELDLNDPRFITPIKQGGYGMDGQWIDEFHHALRVTAGGDTSGYYSDFSGIEQLGKSYQDAYVYDGQYSPHRNKFFGKKTDGAGQQFIVFSQNHDQVGNRMLGERSSILFSFEMQKLMAAAIFVSPFIPMLFMGEEWSEPAPFQYFVSHEDQDLCAAVRKGRKEEFAAFHIDGEAPDPTALETFNTSKLHWDLLDKEHHKTMLAFYKELIQLRKTHPVLNHLERKNVSVDVFEEQNSLLLHRWYGDNHLYCFLNFSKEQQRFSLPNASTQQILLDSSHKKWGGSQRSLINDKEVIVSGESILLLSNTTLITHHS